jgi:membrane protein
LKASHLKTSLIIIKRAFKKFLKDSCLLKAQALAYTTLLAVVPVFVVSFSVFSKFQAFSQLEEYIREFLFKNLSPTSSARLESYLTQFTERATTLGIIGLLGSILTAIFLLDAIERTFNEIWALRKRRPFIPRFISFWAFLTMVPIFLGGSIYTSSFLTKVVNIGAISFLDRLSSILVPYLFALLAFFTAYRLLPAGESTSLPSFIGAAVAAVLWEVTKWGFDLYVTHVLRISRIYGSLGLFPIFLLWLYVVWVTILFGAELAYVIQFPKGRRRDGVVALLYLLHVLLKRYERGEKPISLPTLAKITGIYREDLEQMVGLLESRGWLASTDGGITFAFSPEKMPLVEAVKMGKTLSLDYEAGDLPEEVGRLAKGLLESALKGLEGKTVKDLLKR